MKRFMFGCKKPCAIEYTEVKEPSPALWTVKIQVKASSVNPHDWKYYDFMRRWGRVVPFKRWAIGHDVAGTVVEVGAGVKHIKVGDDVYTMSAKTGAFGEYVCVNQWMVAPMPESLSYTQAATLPLVCLTAYQMYLLTRLKPEQRLLLIGASGGVGAHALQIAKAMGAQVTAVCSTRNKGWVSELGADAIIDYTETDLDQLNETYDLVFDAIGNISPFKCDHLVREGGRFCTTLPRSEIYWAMLLSRLPLRSWYGLGHLRKTTTLLAMPIGQNLRLFSRWVREGKLRPIIDRVFDIESLNEALDYSRAGKAQGKIGLDVNTHEH